MENTIYLHIGTHKTGTSALQSAFRQINNKLRKEGICYLGKPKYFAEIGTATTASNDIIQNTVTELKVKMRRENLFGRNKFIISSEKFSGDPHKGYKNSDTIAEIWRNITDLLDVNVKIIVYLRRQDRFIQSLYTQQIHQGKSFSFSEFIDKFDSNSFNWQLLLSHYESSFSRSQLIVRPYSKYNLPDKNSLFHDFASIIGSRKLKSFNRNKVSNKGYSKDALEIARLINPQLDTAEKKIMRNMLQSVSAKGLHDDYEYFQISDRKKFLSRYKKSNQFVAKTYLEDGKLFNDSAIPESRRRYEGLKKEAILKIYLKTIKEIKENALYEKKLKSNGITPRIRKIITRKMPNLKLYIKLIAGKFY